MSAFKHRFAGHVSVSLSGFSFHFVEAAITGGFNPLLAALLGFHAHTVLACQAYGLINTVCVHAGYELYPLWWNKVRWTKWYLSTQFHDVHHMKVASNYGGFTTVWDRVFGTVDRDFDVLVDALSARAATATSKRPSS